MNTIAITTAVLTTLRTDRGGYTRATVEALGLRWCGRSHGWERRLLGTRLTMEQYRAALDGREIYGGQLPAPQPSEEQRLSDRQYWFLAGHGYPPARLDRLTKRRGIGIIGAVLKADTQRSDRAMQHADESPVPRLPRHPQ